MRLIDADALTKEIEDFNCKDCNHYNYVRCRACPIDDAVTYIDEAPTVGEWVSVNDRLPEKRKAVLAYAPRYNNIWAVVLIDNGWNIWAPVGTKYDPDWDGPITHWMPLPEPPEE